MGVLSAYRSEAILIALGLVVCAALIVVFAFSGSMPVPAETVDATATYTNTPTHFDEVININTASVNELTKLSGIGEVYAKRIVRYREENGAFININEIKNVKGIGEKRFDEIKDHITVK